MKKIEAIVRKSKFADVQAALHDIDLDFFTYWDVTGVGMEKQKRIFRGVTYQEDHIQRLMISIIVRDQDLKRAADAIARAAWTGAVGDGKIFVSHVEEAIRIRNEQTSTESLLFDDKGI